MIIGCPLWAQNNETDQNKIKDKKKSILLYVMSTVAGYNTITGLTYDFTPIGVEIPVSKLIGLRLEPSLIYYSAALKGFSFSMIFPFYFNTNKEIDLYNSFYIAPFVVPAIGFANNTIQFDAGAIAGFTWNLKTNLHFNVGLGLAYDFMFNIIDSYLDLNIGYWFKL